MKNQNNKPKAWINGHIIDSRQINSNLSLTDKLFTNNICYEKAKYVALKVAKICKELSKKQDYVVLNNYLNQIVRSSSSIYANYCEGASPLITPKDRKAKFSICIKEAYETVAWCTLINELGELSKEDANDILHEISQIIKILSKAIITIKNRETLNNL